MSGGNPYEKIDKFLAEGRADEVLRTRATYQHGTRADLPIFYRYVILDTVFDPSIIDDKKLAHWEHDLGVSNMQYATVLPRNTVIARRVLSASSTASEPALFLFPFFPPNLAFPCQPGEHVWVMFEAPGSVKTDLGYWFCRITEPGFVEDMNHVHSPRTYDSSFHPGIKATFDGKDDPKYEFNNGRVVEDGKGARKITAESATIPGDEKAYEKLLTETDGSKLMNYEPVPRFKKRPGDTVIEGSNNSLIVLGCDRTGAVASYTDDKQNGKVPAVPDADTNKEGSGAIDIVVGRGQTSKTLGKVVTNVLGTRELAKATKDVSNEEGNPDLKTDRSRVLVSQRTKPDKNFGLDSAIKKHSKSTVVDEPGGSGAVVVKSDKLRIVARQDVVILVTGSREKDENGNVKDVDVTPEKCASIIIKTNGDIILTPSEDGILRLGGEDANLAVLCTEVNNAGVGGQVTASPIIDSMGGSQGGAGGLNGSFSKKILIK